MNLQKFPLDSQVCPLEIGSFGHPGTDIIYKWADTPLRSVTIALSLYLRSLSSMDTLSLAQYVMINWTYGETFGDLIGTLQTL